MKKIIAKSLPCLALCALMALGLAACGSNGTASNSANTANTANTANVSSTTNASNTASASNTANASHAENASNTAKTSNTAAAADALANTTWTAEVGEAYGAATQGDNAEEPTSLTLHFTDQGTAYNVVGDISFDYVLNADGTVSVSNLDLGKTGISKDSFTLTYKDGSLVLKARINGGNATLTFEKQ